jgi:cytochrome c oxidase subunit 2
VAAAGQAQGLAMIQMRALAVFIGAAAVLVLAFVYVALSTRRARDIDLHSAYAVRRKLFFLLLAVLATGLGLSLGHMPYPRGNELPGRVVFVVGKQFAFGLSDGPILSDAQYQSATYAEPVSLPAGALVEFRVTSFDVNHGFSLYSPGGQLLAQTQAMPGYVNRLRVRLDEPGAYTVLCLELCGMGHHRMRGILYVK